MKVRFDFNLEAWISHLDIEADSYEEAEEKFMKMTVEELIAEGNIRDFAITNTDVEVLEKTLTVRVYDIEYDIEEDDYDDLDEYNRIINLLPSELDLTVTVEFDQDQDSVIADEITYETDWLVKNFKYDILEEN